MQAKWLGRAAAALGIAGALAAGALVHGLWRVSQQLAHIAPALDAHESAARSSVDAPTASPSQLEAVSSPPVAAAAAEVASDAVRERFDDEHFTRQSWNEAPDDRASLERLLGDPDPDVRGEAAALLRAFDAELLLSAGSD
jgi:hypothetical protein